MRAIPQSRYNKRFLTALYRDTALLGSPYVLLCRIRREVGATFSTPLFFCVRATLVLDRFRSEYHLPGRCYLAGYLVGGSGATMANVHAFSQSTSAIPAAPAPTAVASSACHASRGSACLLYQAGRPWFLHVYKLSSRFALYGCV